MTNPVLAILLTTYQRTYEAVQTVRSIKENLIYDQVLWYVSDDGSPSEHVRSILDEIGPNYQTYFYNSERKGVGHGMNHCLRHLFSMDINEVMTMEDDWNLSQPLHFEPYMRLLENHAEYGMIRFGYLSPNLLGYLASEEGKLYWRLEPNGETYRFTGHPSLRHRRFFEQYGFYDEGLAPGLNELAMCGKVNAKKDGPFIVYPAECGQWGFWGHIGARSLADISPAK